MAFILERDGLWRLLIALLVLFAVVVLVTAIYTRRRSVLRDLVLAGALALCISLAVSRIVIGSYPAVWDAFAAVLLYRAATLYLPPIGGFFARGGSNATSIFSRL